MLFRSHFSGTMRSSRKIICNNCRRNTEGRVIAGLPVDPRRQKHQLVGVDHRIAVDKAGISMPFSLRVEVPTLLLLLDDAGRQLLPGNVACVFGEGGPLYSYHVGHEGIEKPLLLCSPAILGIELAELAQFLAHFDAKFDAAVPQDLTTLAIMDLGIDLE